MLIICPECGKDISDCALVCPNCGFPMHEYTKEPETDFFASGEIEYESEDQETPYDYHAAERPTLSAWGKVRIIIVALAVLVVSVFAIYAYKTNAEIGKQTIIIQKQYEQAKQAFERKNWEEVIAITDEILSKNGEGTERNVIELNEQARKEIEIEKSLASVTTIDKEMLNYFMDSLYDPDSLKVYGNVLCVSTGPDSEVIEIKCNSKNRTGGYVGVSKIEICYDIPNNDIFFLKEDSEHYLDLSFLYGMSQEDMDNRFDSTFSARVLNGEAIARLLNVEYVG